MNTMSLYTGTLKRGHHADTGQGAFGIYRHDRAPGDGSFLPPVLTATDQPGWLIMAGDGATLYALNEVREFEGEAGGAITAFAVDPAHGDLTRLGHVRVGGNPCHGAIDATGRYLIAATFHGGAVHMFRLAGGGALGEECAHILHRGASIHPKRQTSPHPHGIAITPDNTLVLVPDLGTDRVEVYALNADAGTLTHRPERALIMPPGSGPRHACFNHDGTRAYVINEMSATLAVIGIEPEHCRVLQMVDLLPADFAGLRSGGEVALSADGRHLYATTRSHGSSGMPDKPGIDAIHWLVVEGDTGLLRPVGSCPTHGGIPRAFALNGDEIWIAHQCNSTIARHPIDRVTGAVGPATQVIDSPVPVCLILSLTDTGPFLD